MDFTRADVFVYQVLDCLVTEYDYKIVNVPREKKDIWIANEKNDTFPMIRLNAQSTSSTIFEQDYLGKVKSALMMVLNKQAPLLMINTNEESSSFVEEDYVQIVLTSDKVSDTSLFDAFPKLARALKVVDNNEQECIRLQHHLQSNQMHKLKESRKFKWSTAPKVTVVIAAFCVLVFAIIQLFVYNGSDSWLATLIASGGYYKALVVYNQEYWRILTTGFIHLDFITLLFYIMAIFQVGRICEKVYPVSKYAIIFLGSLFVGNVFPLIFNDNIVTFGLGAGLFGALAALVVYARDTKLYKNKLWKMQFNQIIFITLISSFLNGNAFSSQVGGFLTGLFLAIIFYQGESLKIYKKHFIACGIIILGVIGYAGLQVNSAYPQLSELDKAVVKEYKALGFEEYAKQIETRLKDAYKE